MKNLNDFINQRPTWQKKAVRFLLDNEYALTKDNYSELIEAAKNSMSYEYWEIFTQNYKQEIIQGIEITQEQKQAAQRWQKHIRKNLNLAEQNIKPDFLQEVFVEILGYQKSMDAGDADWTIENEYTIAATKKRPDGVLGFFNHNQKNPQVVIEVKGPKVNLQTAVHQAFRDANALDSVQWVITSNCKELRLYRKEHKNMYESFDLTKIADNEDQLKLLLLLLSKENLIVRQGESKINEIFKDFVENNNDDSNKFEPRLEEATADESLNIVLPPITAKTVKLQSINKIKHVNNLHAGAKLEFEKPITVIYGNNGAGKSGYARILKHACSARMKKDKNIYANIYDSNSGTPQAELQYTINGEVAEPTKWVYGQEEASDLAAIHVFDSDTANVQVDGNNELVYTPPEIKLVECLAEAVKNIRGRLASEQAELQISEVVQDKINEFKEKGRTTKVTNMLEDLTAYYPVAIERLAVWDTKEKEKYEFLNKEVLSNQDKETLKKALEASTISLKVQFKESNLNDLETAAANENFNNIFTQKKDWDEKKKLADEAKDKFPKVEDLLLGFNTPEWKNLWEAAREYSRTEAYRNKTFPYTTDTEKEKAKCVLCQQSLDEDSKNRLQSFENFYQDKTQLAAKTAKEAYESKREELEKLQGGFTEVRVKDIAKLMLGLAHIEKSLVADFEKAVLQNIQRIQSFLKGVAIETLPKSISLVEPCKKQVEAWTKKITDLSAEKGTEEYQDLVDKFNELEDCQWLNQHKVAVLNTKEMQTEKIAAEHFLDSKENKILQFTKQITTLADESIKSPFKQIFVEKLKLFELHNLEGLDFRLSAPQGSLPKLELKVSGHKGASNILSAGEQRCVAIAAFLAEVEQAENKSTLVFDDPVSSLDHNHRKQVAECLVEAGKKQQIVVFTYDREFAEKLMPEFAKKSNLNLGKYKIENKNGKIGVCTSM